MRYLLQQIEKDLKRKMVFLGGPRQVGKTTLALNLLGKNASEKNPSYFNYDSFESRRALLDGRFPAKSKILIFDELHKYARWRNWIKGIYDTHKSDYKILVTGSARLDYYRKGGDSLVGRYHYLRLHPFSLNEMTNNCKNNNELDALLKFGGFPEPLLGGSENEWRRWQKERKERVVREDLRDLERVREISLIDELADTLPLRVGSVLSVNSLREDLQVSHKAVENWISILERLYYCFRIPPFGAPRLRAVKKEQKLYMWDWSLCDKGARFENLVASQLLKYCHFREDTEGHRMELRFFRDIDQREVDFIVLQDRKPLFAVECKTGEGQISKGLSYFKERVKIKDAFQVHLGKKDYLHTKTKIRVLPFTRFCKDLDLP